MGHFRPADPERSGWQGEPSSRASGETLSVLRHGDIVDDLAWSPDVSRLVTASQDGTVRVWDVASGAELQQLSGHSGGVWSVAYSPDGTRIAFRSHHGGPADIYFKPPSIERLQAYLRTLRAALVR